MLLAPFRLSNAVCSAAHAAPRLCRFLSLSRRTLAEDPSSKQPAKDSFENVDRAYAGSKSSRPRSSQLISRILEESTRSHETDASTEHLLEKFAPINHVTLKNLPRTGPYTGRSVEVFDPSKLISRLQVLDRIVQANNVFKQTRSYMAFEKPHHKRRRLNQERSVLHYKRAYGHMVNRMQKLRRMGY